MKKRWMTAAVLACVLGMLAGCGKKDIRIADLKDLKTEDYVTLPDYKNLQMAKPEKVEISDDYVKSYIHSKINAVSALHELAGSVENGDVVNIDYAGTIDGTAFQGGTAQGQLLEIGSGSFIEGFEEGLIGAGVGETKQLSLKFPENYRNADLAGKDCGFAVKINYILAELTDENVNLVDDGYQSVQEYREDAKSFLTEYTEYEYERTLRNNIATSLITGCTYQEIPQSLIDDYKNDLKADFEDAAAEAGVGLEEYMMQVYRVSADNLEDELGTMAKRCAKEGLALQAIAEQEGIFVSDEELDAAIAEYELEEDGEKENIKMNLLYNKVYEFLVNFYIE